MTLMAEERMNVHLYSKKINEKQPEPEHMCTNVIETAAADVTLLTCVHDVCFIRIQIH